MFFASVASSSTMSTPWVMGFYAAGSTTSTVVPLPGWLASEMEPPKRSMMRRASARPTPRPLVFVVWKANARASCSLDIPGPLSWMLMRKSPSVARSAFATMRPSRSMASLRWRSGC